ncbi:Protein tilB [Nowakowskiella sp. JEL0407]|nr:Protein tilB [Nowakowskiella sp. JEL0407]
MGEKITEKLLRKRAEHNDGELSTLREITLHQFDIEKIENLDVFCRHLEILLLQHNQISKIENLHKLKELQYLNLALNNITRIENLEGCESLTKLDLTVNFVDNLLDVENLKSNGKLRELYLVGNPCAQVEGYRSFVIASIPQLLVLDGIDIEKTERIIASQEYETIREKLIQFQETKTQTTNETAVNSENQVEALDREELVEQKRKDFQTKLVPHTPESRIQTARDLSLMRDPNPAPPPAPPLPVPVLSSTGRVLQKNQGNWDFSLKTLDTCIVLRVGISKYIDTSLIDVDVHQTYIRVTVKGKVLQLVLEKDVNVNETICERSKANGELCVTMLIKDRNNRLNVEEEVQKLRKKQSEKHKEAFTGGKPKPEKELKKMSRRDLLFVDSTKEDKTIKINEVRKEFVEETEFVDDPDVPPLC